MSLTATVTPGKTFVAAELVTNSKLNQLAAPSVSIAGTADTTQISNDSVTAAKAAFGPWFYGVGGGSATAHTVTIAGHTLAAYVDGLIVRYRVGSGNDSVTDQAGVTLTSSGTTATCTTPSAHALAIGDKVMVYDATQDDYNGTFQVASVGSATTFTYVFAGSATSPATGTINVRYSAVGGEGSFIQTSGVTVDVAGLGAKNLFGPAGTRLMPGEIIAGEIIEILYNGTSNWFEILSRETASEVIRAVDNSATANAYAAQATDGRTTLLVNNTLLVCRMALANTSTATLTLNGANSGTIRKNGLTALTRGDIIGGQWCQFVWDGTYWQLLSPTLSTRTTVPVRQCVLSCSADGTTGLPNYLSGVATTSIGFLNCDTTNLVMAFAYGFDTAGAVDYVAVVNTNTSSVWTGLSAASTTYYLYADRNISTGAITYDKTTTRPIYTNVPGTGNNTYIIPQSKMVNGSSTAIQRLFLGEAVTTALNVISTITPYMPRGEFVSSVDIATTLTDSIKTDTHQLGLVPRTLRCVLVCQTQGGATTHGYAIGDELNANAHGYNGVNIELSANATTLTNRTNWSSYLPYLLNGAAAPVITPLIAADWKWRFYAGRGW